MEVGMKYAMHPQPCATTSHITTGRAFSISPCQVLAHLTRRAPSLEFPVAPSLTIAETNQQTHGHVNTEYKLNQLIERHVRCQRTHVTQPENVELVRPNRHQWFGHNIQKPIRTGFPIIESPGIS